MSLKGTNPPGAKAAQGELYVAAVTAEVAETDTTEVMSAEQPVEMK